MAVDLPKTKQIRGQQDGRMQFYSPSDPYSACLVQPHPRRCSQTPGFPLLPHVCLGSAVTYRCNEWSMEWSVTPFITLESYRQEGFSAQGHPWLYHETLSPQETGDWFCGREYLHNTLDLIPAFSHPRMWLVTEMQGFWEHAPSIHLRQDQEPVGPREDNKMVMEVKRREIEKLNNRYKINEVHCVVKILQSNSIILSYLLLQTAFCLVCLCGTVSIHARMKKMMKEELDLCLLVYLL